jgi:hypothetical protein
MRMPEFTADFSLRRTTAHYSVTSGLDRRASGVIPARITCPVPGLAIACMVAGGPFFIFPCFGNECCVLGHAAVFGNPVCAICSCGG